MAPSASKTWPKIPKKVVLGISVYPEQITSVGILRRGPVPDNRCPTHQQRALVFRRNMQSHMDDAPTDPVEIQKVSPLPCSASAWTPAFARDSVYPEQITSVC